MESSAYVEKGLQLVSMLYSRNGVDELVVSSLTLYRREEHVNWGTTSFQNIRGESNRLYIRGPRLCIVQSQNRPVFT